MNPVRLTTGVGIAVGGIGGALLALLGTPKTTAPVPPAPHAEPPPLAASAATARASASEPPVAVASGSAPASASTLASAPASAFAAAQLPSAVAEPKAVASAAIGVAPALKLATTRDALLKSEMVCDQKQDFDECERAAESLEKGTAGPADLEQAKRFRRIALTHLVAKCEAGSPHACFVLAGKYRAGTELTASPANAEALEKRGLELCHLRRRAPECPNP